MEYDFYMMGVRRAQEKLRDLDQLANEIEKKYGADARIQFESGVAECIPVYSNIMSKRLTDEDIKSQIYDEETGTKKR